MKSPVRFFYEGIVFLIINNYIRWFRRFLLISHVNFMVNAYTRAGCTMFNQSWNEMSTSANSKRRCLRPTNRTINLLRIFWNFGRKFILNIDSSPKSFIFIRLWIPRRYFSFPSHESDIRLFAKVFLCKISRNWDNKTVIRKPKADFIISTLSSTKSFLGDAFNHLGWIRQMSGVYCVLCLVENGYISGATNDFKSNVFSVVKVHLFSVQLHTHRNLVDLVKVFSTTFKHSKNC